MSAAATLAPTGPGAGKAQSREQRILECAARLPSPPEIVTALIGAIGDDAKGADLIVGLLERDQALTARVLKVANSSFYGMTGRIGTVRGAVVTLGFRTISNLVIAVEITQRYATPRGQYAGLGRFWRHSMLVAICAAALGRRGAGDEGTAFTAGLLHDIGKLVLASAFPGEPPVAPPPQEAGNCLPDLLATERERFGADHASIGGMIAEQWHFPVEISTALRDHHDSHARHALARLVGHADRIAHALASPAPARAALEATAGALIALEAQDCAPDLLAEIQGKADAAAHLLKGLD